MTAADPIEASQKLSFLSTSSRFQVRQVSVITANPSVVTTTVCTVQYLHYGYRHMMSSVLRTRTAVTRLLSRTRTTARTTIHSIPSSP